jgi:hypothetical protein
MRQTTVWAGALVTGLTLIGPAGLRANDTLAVFGAGGLQFEQTDKVRMEREDLYLSPREVRVSYVFRNLTDHDVSGRVAFPMPEVNVGQISESPHDFHKSARNGDIFDFHVEVDGCPVAAEYDARAYINNADGSKDVTDLLKKHRVSLVDPDDSLIDANAMKDLTAARVFNKDHGDGADHPSWSVKATYHWTQVFPAQQETRITHRYKPVLGGSAHNASFDIDMKEWCTDDAFARAVKKLPATAHSSEVVTRWLEYVLKTGANWAGPITNFRLEIDKAGADLVSFCPIPGLKLERRGRNFVGEAKQYTPTADLKLLFFFRACNNAPCKDADWPGLPR